MFALAYAARALHVLPCQRGGKLPITAHGLCDATTSAAIITQWWTATPDANIGIACAASGLVVIDVDRHGADGFRTMKALVAELGQLPETAAAVTGGGGRHLVFSAPACTEFRGSLGAGVDLKYHGYILVEPSIHPSGNNYRWLRSPLDRPPAALPDSWLARMRKPAAPRVASRPSVVRTTEATKYGRVAAEREIERVRTAPEGERNRTLNTSACKLGSLCAGGELGDCREELVAAAMSAGLPEYEARTTTESGWRAGLSKPRVSQTKGMAAMMSSAARGGL
jgi:hypothetical protein